MPRQTFKKVRGQGWLTVDPAEAEREKREKLERATAPALKSRLAEPRPARRRYYVRAWIYRGTSSMSAEADTVEKAYEQARDYRDIYGMDPNAAVVIIENLSNGTIVDIAHWALVVTERGAIPEDDEYDWVLVKGSSHAARK